MDELLLGILNICPLNMHEGYPVSGTLNNCGLHVLVPRILKLIQPTTTERNRLDFPILETIKSNFELFYGLTKPLSWEEFYRLLNQPDDPYVAQVYLGPVLRTLFSDNENYSHLVHLDKSTARYPKLEAQEINFIANQLGCYIHYHAFFNGQDVSFKNENQTFEPIHIYYDSSSEHWNLSARVTFILPKDSLKRLTEIFNEGVYRYSNYGLQLLIISLRIRLKRQQNSVDSEESEKKFAGFLEEIHSHIHFEQTQGATGKQIQNGIQTAIDLYNSPTQPKPALRVDNSEPKDLLNQLIDELKNAPSGNWFFFSVFSRDDKIKQMIDLQNNSSLSVEQKFKKLVQIATTQRNRLGFFCFHVRRNNSFKTQTGHKLIQLLAEDKYFNLRSELLPYYKSDVSLEDQLRRKFLAKHKDYRFLFNK